MQVSKNSLPMSASKKPSKVDAVKEAIDEASSELDEREKALEQREEALRKAVEGVEHEKRLMAGCTPSDVLSLNIGGIKCTMLRKTLCQYDKSMLAARFSGRWDDSIEKDPDGAYFIDQPYDLMKPLIDFLRAKAIETPSMPAHFPKLPDGLDATDFYRAVEYFGLTPFVYQQRFHLHRGLAGSAGIVDGPEPSVSCTSWSTFLLHPLGGHSRGQLKSFEIVLESSDCPQIGWAAYTAHGVPGFNPASGSSGSSGKGLGEEGLTIALDGHRRGVYSSGTQVVATPALALQAGSVVACEFNHSHFRWLVDGAEVAEVRVDSLPTAHGSFSDSRNDGKPHGAISCAGHWRVSQYSY